MRKHKGQVTIFMILGLVILAAAVFLFVLSSSLKTSQLTTASEDVITGVFEKEGLRIFVEDCLNDGIEEGLTLIGSQGRLWDTNPGGSLAFSEGINGVTWMIGGEEKQLYYALTYLEDFMFPNSYPCTEKTNETPAFCMYSHTTLGQIAQFGKTEQLGARDIERDLSRFLEESTISCVQELIAQNLSISSSIREDDLEIDVELESGGFNVHATYPLELFVDDSTYFHLTDFDFFYPSKFRSLLRTAVTLPIRSEGQNVDYLYIEEELEESAIYRELSAEFTTQDLATGDRILEFTLDAPKILKNSEPYTFRFAIENRPPALDYIERDACSAYDYLVVPGVETEEGQVDISFAAQNLAAHDPDDDTPFFAFGSVFDSEGGILETKEGDISPYYRFTPDTTIEAKVYNLTVTSFDQYGAQDWQDVRVLVDRPVEVGIVLETPYYNSTDIPSPFIVSIEDPVFIRMNMPTTSIVQEDIDESLSLSYTNYGFLDELEEIDLTISLSDQTENCVAFPNNVNAENSADFYVCYDDRYEHQIEQWKEDFVANLPEDSAHFTKITPDTGLLSLMFESNYCGEYSQAPVQAGIPIQVQECIYHDNATFPYAAPYHEESVDPVTNERTIVPGANPFLANHSCCSITGEYLGSDTVCYQSEPDCHGGIPGWTDSAQTDNYIVEIEQDFCSGTRGNVCGDGTTNVFETATDHVLCGNNQTPSCSSIPTQCEDQLAWGKSTIEDGWCHGRMGCSEFCVLGVIYEGGVLDQTALNLYGLNGLGQRAKQIPATRDDSDNEFNFACATCEHNEGKFCDLNFDGRWGVCGPDTGTNTECFGD